MYQLISYKGVVQDGVVKNTETGTLISFLDSNPMYQEYLEWVAEGNTPLPADSE